MGMDTQRSASESVSGKVKQGFSLIELMVVLIIISILGSQTVPTIADAWENFMLRRMAAKVMVIISIARQHAITDERGTLIHFHYNTWCIRYQDENEQICSLGTGRLAKGFYFGSQKSTQFQLLYSAGRGFSPLSAGAARLLSQRSAKHVHFINSSLGRVRLCSAQAIPGIEPC